VSGIGLIFWPEIARLASGTPLAVGATLTACAVLTSGLANMVESPEATVWVDSGRLLVIEITEEHGGTG